MVVEPLDEERLAHPLLALAVVTLSVIVIVHFLTYILLGAIGLGALTAFEARR